MSPILIDYDQAVERLARDLARSRKLKRTPAKYHYLADAFEIDVRPVDIANARRILGPLVSQEDRVRIATRQVNAALEQAR